MSIQKGYHYSTFIYVVKQFFKSSKSLYNVMHPKHDIYNKTKEHLLTPSVGIEPTTTWLKATRSTS